MSQSKKDLEETKPKESKNLNKKASSGTKSTKSKKAEADKLVKEAKQALIVEDEVATKVSKKRKTTEDKTLTAYEEQALQGATKSKGNKKLLILLLLLISFVVIGVAVALFFVLKPEEESKAVVCEVSVLSYHVKKSLSGEEYVVLGAGDRFNFTQETQTTSSFTKDIETSIDETTDFSMMYLINNVTKNEYSYTLNFSNFTILNCDVVVKVNNGDTYKINDATRAITISHFGDVVLEIRIAGKNPPVYDENDRAGWEQAMQDWLAQTGCDGSIDLTLEVN